MIFLYTRLALCVGSGHFYDFKETLFNCFICLFNRNQSGGLSSDYSTIRNMHCQGRHADDIRQINNGDHVVIAQTKMKSFDFSPRPSTDFVKAEIVKWARVVKTAGVRAD